MKRILIALGGNALGNTPEEQLLLADKTAKALIPLVSEGNELIITHGNGPQVGMINLAFESASVPKMPFPECNALSEGYIGYHLQNALGNELKKYHLKKEVVTIITQVEVNPDDPAFFNPTKPIGSFYSEQEAKLIEKERGYLMREDSGRGYRRVIASPKPINILEAESIKTLVEAGQIVIACGGGGIPVVKKEGRFYGIDAVIDKDYASSLLAGILQADYFFILTAVDKVAINFGQEDQRNLDIINFEDAKKYLQEGHFKKGSMLPKVEAALSFLEVNPKGVAVIASLEKATEALIGEAGTRIIK
jgi:carbamate kinase